MNTIQQIRNAVLSLVLLTCLNGYANAIDTAPRISDREIIEGLGSINTKIANLEGSINTRISNLEGSINTRISNLEGSINTQIASIEGSINAKIASLEGSINAKIVRIEGSINTKIVRIEAGQQTLNQRFTDLQTQTNQHFNYLETLIMIMLSSIFGLIGFVIWDRKTAMKPLDQKLVRVEKNLIKIEKDLEHDLELGSKEGSKLTRLVNAFRELSTTNKEVEAILKRLQLT